MEVRDRRQERLDMFSGISWAGSTTGTSTGSFSPGISTFRYCVMREELAIFILSTVAFENPSCIIAFRSLRRKHMNTIKMVNMSIDVSSTKTNTGNSTGR